VKYQTLIYLTFAFICLLSLSSCAAAGPTSSEAGFFAGIIHGIVLFPFALLAKLFGMDYSLYAEHNSGFFYWIGYVIGIGGLGTGVRAAL
jgi:hypothetical protein